MLDSFVADMRDCPTLFWRASWFMFHQIKTSTYYESVAPMKQFRGLQSKLPRFEGLIMYGTIQLSDRTRKAMLSLVLVGSTSVSQGSAQDLLTNKSQLEFEVASVKPYKPSTRNASVQIGWCRGIDSKFDSKVPITPPALGRCDFINLTLRELIALAYFSRSNTPMSMAVSGGPDWINQDRFEIQAKAEDPKNTTDATLTQMLQPLLRDRFNLRFHIVPKEVSGYALVVGNNGLKISPASGDAPGSVQTGSSVGGLKAENATMSHFVSSIRGRLNAPVIDKTGLVDMYSFSISFGDDPTSILWRVQDLGLRFEPVKVMVETIVVDHAEKPSVD